MAKKKAASKTRSPDDIFKEKFGENVIVSGNYITSKDRQVVPISPKLDYILNGGVQFGSFVIPTGPPKVGKTSMSIDMAATALKIPTHFDKPRKLFFFNIEGRLTKRDLMGIHHMRSIVEEEEKTGEEMIQVVTSSPGNILTAENFLEIGETLINQNPGSVFIFDSFSQLCSKEGKDKEWDGKAYRDNVPVFLSQFCKRISNIIPINESIVVGITHQIANTGFGFSSWAEASGNKIQYAVDVKLKASHSTPWMDGETMIGQDIHWQCFCSPLHNGPVEPKTISKFRYGWGIDKSAELVELAVDLGIIEKGGSWYTIGEQKVQGLEKAVQLLNDDPELYNSINAQYREAMDLPCA